MTNASPRLALLTGLAAVVLLSLGFQKTALRLDPVSKQSQKISTLQTGELATHPCMPCAISSGNLS
jgi:hypothetical protein